MLIFCRFLLPPCSRVTLRVTARCIAGALHAIIFEECKRGCACPLRHYARKGAAPLKVHRRQQKKAETQSGRLEIDARPLLATIRRLTTFSPPRNLIALPTTENNYMAHRERSLSLGEKKRVIYYVCMMLYTTAIAVCMYQVCM